MRLSDGALTVLLAQDLATASSSLPTPLLLSTIKGASPFGAGRATAGVVSSEVAALADEVLKASLYSKIRNTTAVLLASTLRAWPRRWPRPHLGRYDDARQRRLPRSGR